MQFANKHAFAGLLAGILLWIWLREHPAQHPVAGLIDEV